MRWNRLLIASCLGLATALVVVLVGTRGPRVPFRCLIPESSSWRLERLGSLCHPPPEGEAEVFAPAQGEEAVDVSLPPGHYRLTLIGAGAAVVTVPVLVLPDQGSITWDLRDPGPPGYVPIPPGPFIDGPRGPLRSTEVLIYADRHEVTQDAWREFLAATDGKRPPGGEGQRVEGVDGAPDGGDAAVTGVNFDDAVSFAAWMTATRGQGRFLFRLPTALEWKKMSRGTDGRLHPWGNDSREDPFRKAHSGSTESVRTHPEWCSPYGLHHMESNAAEWTADAADPAGVRRVVMGRSFSPEADQVRILAGIGDPASRRAPDLGFRLVAEPVLP